MPETESTALVAAPKGNRFWEARSRHGRLPIYTSAEMLWEAATDYFAWVDDNPLWEDKIAAYQGAVTHEPIAKMRAMTIGGLCIFLDISVQAWSEYKLREGYGEVTKQIETIIRDQKFVGAAADLLNASIIARDLGMDSGALAIRASIPLPGATTDEPDDRRLIIEVVQATAITNES